MAYYIQTIAVDSDARISHRDLHLQRVLAPYAKPSCSHRKILQRVRDIRKKLKSIAEVVVTCLYLYTGASLIVHTSIEQRMCI